MLNSVLIVEDHQSTNSWLQGTFKELGFTDCQYVYYCDDALTRLKGAIREGHPFDLLISDLSFAGDRQEQKIKEGSKLIGAAKEQQPNLKVLVFSAEQNETAVNGLFQQLGINGYVRKSPRDLQDLKEAIEAISKGKKYIPLEFQQSVRHKNGHDFTSYDTLVISQLAKGMLQKDIPAYLEQNGFRASSLSSVEKRLSQMKEAFGFTKNEQLVAYCKDYKII
jgi:two-component system capsular synthesis response regulator RcsB